MVYFLFIFLLQLQHHLHFMASKNNAPTWADQWGAGSFKKGGDGSGSNEKKTTVAGNVKAAASESLVKAKAAALVGAQKVKSGTSSGIKWVKDQYQKRASK
uniref:Uncharacterized protein n=1 Tax=Leersia perrieri TaxID=77586 RepID=A0A0D9VVU6_9ORYZ